MRMRQDDGAQGHSLVVEDSQDLVGFSARVDENAFAGAAAPEQGGIATEVPRGEDQVFKSHGWPSFRQSTSRISPEDRIQTAERSVTQSPLLA